MEGFRDETGLFGVFNHRRAAHVAYLGLHALQARGRDGVGLVASDGDVLRSVHGEGRVHEALGGAQLDGLPGPHALGQVVRVPSPVTPRASEASIGVPVVGRYKGGQVAVAMAGRFTNGAALRDALKGDGAVFAGLSDAEVALHLIARSTQGTLVNRVVDALCQVRGAYSLLILSEDRLIAVRDPHGFRPLVRGRVGDATVLATEDGPIRLLGGELQGEVLPGQLVVVDAQRASTIRPFLGRERAACIQEPLQLASSDAAVFGVAAHAQRVALGERLAREAPCAAAQVVVPLPGAGSAIAGGYARVSGIPLREGLLPKDDLGRARVEPPSDLRDVRARLRWTPVPAVVEGLRVALVAPSVGDGIVLRQAVGLLREVGAAEVHLRIAAPLLGYACPYGVVGPTTDELAARRLGGLPAVGTWLGADSLSVLSGGGLHETLGAGGEGHRGWCDGCISGQWPVPPDEDLARHQLDLFTSPESQAE